MSETRPRSHRNRRGSPVPVPGNGQDHQPAHFELPPLDVYKQDTHQPHPTLNLDSRVATPLPTIDDILARGLDYDWLIEGWIERRQCVVLFGDTQACKTLEGIDMGCCIATGTPWCGQPVKQGAVCFIVGEGAGAGLTRRFKAWEIANGISLKGAPIFFIEEATTLPLDTDRVIKQIRATLDAYGWKLELIELDTLSRTITGSERDSKDFSEYQHALDLLRDAFDCTRLILHHVGHIEKNRERGASEIGKNADVRLFAEILADGTRKLTPIKVKDAEPPEPMFFALTQVDLGVVDKRSGKPITSVVLRQLSEYQQPETDKRLGGRALQALHLLDDMVIKERERFREMGAAIPPESALVKLDAWQEIMRAIVKDKGDRSTIRKQLIAGGYVSGPDSYGFICLSAKGAREVRHARD